MLDVVSQCQKCGAPIIEAAPGVPVGTCLCSKGRGSTSPDPSRKFAQPPPPDYFSTQADLVEAISIIKEVISQECSKDDGVESRGKYPFAKAIKFLAKKNLVTINTEKGPIIKATWK